MAVRDDHGRTSVREVAEAEGGRVLRALDPDCPDRVLDVDVEVMIRGVVVMLGFNDKPAIIFVLKQKMSSVATS